MPHYEGRRRIMGLAGVGLLLGLSACARLTQRLQTDARLDPPPREDIQSLATRMFPPPSVTLFGPEDSVLVRVDTTIVVDTTWMPDPTPVVAHGGTSNARTTHTTPPKPAKGAKSVKGAKRVQGVRTSPATSGTRAVRRIGAAKAAHPADSATRHAPGADTTARDTTGAVTADATARDTTETPGAPGDPRSTPPRSARFEVIPYFVLDSIWASAMDVFPNGVPALPREGVAARPGQAPNPLAAYPWVLRRHSASGATTGDLARLGDGRGVPSQTVVRDAASMTLDTLTWTPLPPWPGARVPQGVLTAAEQADRAAQRARVLGRLAPGTPGLSAKRGGLLGNVFGTFTDRFGAFTDVEAVNLDSAVAREVRETVDAQRDWRPIATTQDSLTYHRGWGASYAALRPGTPLALRATIWPDSGRIIARSARAIVMETGWVSLRRFDPMELRCATVEPPRMTSDREPAMRYHAELRPSVGGDAHIVVWPEVRMATGCALSAVGRDRLHAFRYDLWEQLLRAATIGSTVWIER